MDAQRWQTIEDLFLKASELSQDDRRNLLDEACAEDSDLRQEVEELLAADSDVETPIGQAIGAALQGAGSLSSQLRIDRYELGRELGRGGMGTVFLARRSDHQYRMQVAIKVSRQGVFHSDVRERMRQERQILAALDHPNICRLLDGGTTEEGMPYFVMEYIEGEPIDLYCERHELSLEASLQLFRQVCDAVHFAHRQLVIHRDLKPSNILVTEDGVPKLLDFGIAKLLDASEPNRPVDVTTPLVTRSGMRLLTPAYASPEQLLGRPLSTASDVYSLGVLLYQLLAGRLPYRLDDVTYAEMERRVCEQEPPLASTVVSTSTLPAAPERARRLSGDLDNILAKALRKEPEARYGSVDQLADDLDRHLSGEMVRARPHTLGYRASKFLRRNRVAVTALILIVLSLTTGLGVAIWQARVASFERQKAEEQRAYAEEQRAYAEEQQALAEQAEIRTKGALELTIDIFNVGDPDIARGETLTVREALDLAVPKIRQDLSQNPLDRAVLLDVAGRIYQNLGLYEKSEDLLREVLALRIGNNASDLEVAASQNHLGEFLLKKDRAKEAEGLFRMSLELRRQAESRTIQDVAESLINLGTALYFQQLLDDAKTSYTEGLELLQSEPSKSPADLIKPLSNLGAIYWSQGHLDAAEKRFQEILELSQAQLGEDHPTTLGLLSNLVTALHSQKKFQQAKPLARQSLELRRHVLEDDHPEFAQSLNMLSVVLYELGELEAAEAFQREAIAIKERKYIAGHRSTLSSRNNMGQLHLADGDYARAVTLYEDVVRLRRQSLGDDHPRVRRDLGQLAEGQLMTGQLERASSSFQAALADPADAETYPEHYAMASCSLAATLLQLGRPAEALPHFEMARSLMLELDSLETWQALRLHGTSWALAQMDGNADRATRAWNELRPYLETLENGSDGPQPPRERLALAYLRILIKAVGGPPQTDSTTAALFLEP